MSNEISPDVDYLIEIWKRIDRKAIEMKIIYETIEIDRQNDFDLTLTKDKPEIKLVEQSNKWKTLVRNSSDVISTRIPSFCFVLFCFSLKTVDDRSRCSIEC